MFKMTKLAWIFAFLPFCLGAHELSNETCMNVANLYPLTFTSLVNSSTLRVCSQELEGKSQCCSQSDEDVLGMTLNNAIRYNVSLGIELQQLQDNAMNYVALYDLSNSLINDVLRPLMNDSVDRINTAQSFGSLDMIREEVLDNINSTIQGTMDANLTYEMIRYFTEGICAYYVNLSFNVEDTGRNLDISPTEMACAIDAVYQHLFPPMEQVKIASLGNNLQQIAVAYEVARALMSSIATILTKLQNFAVTPTCTDIWTKQYACPLCVGRATPLCVGRCNEVLIGCMSSLRQVIVQLNVLLDFLRASVSSLISGEPYASINVNNIDDLYSSAFETSIGNTELLEGVINNRNGANCEIGSKKRSIDNRYKRQSNVEFQNVTIDQSIVTMINDQLLPTVMNVSLDSDRIALCDFLMANGSDTNCTIGVDEDSSYTSSFDSREIADQDENNNPAGNFNLTQLYEQAGNQTYAVTELLTDRSDIMMLYENVLPERDIPNLNFLIEPTSSFTTVTATATATATPRPSQPGGDGGATALSFSSFITLVALLLASVFVN